MAGTVNVSRSLGGSGAYTIHNTNPDITTYTILGVGVVESSEDLPEASDYPGAILNVGDVTGGTVSLYHSNGDEWREISVETT